MRQMLVISSPTGAQCTGLACIGLQIIDNISAQTNTCLSDALFITEIYEIFSVKEIASVI